MSGMDSKSVERAVERLLELAVSGAGAAAIVEAVNAEFPKLSIDDLGPALKQRLELETSSASPAAVRGWAFLCYRRIYEQAMKAGSWGDAIRAVKETVALAGTCRAPAPPAEPLSVQARQGAAARAADDESKPCLSSEPTTATQRKPSKSGKRPKRSARSKRPT